MPPPAPTLLCVCNYASSTGYAWDFIESLYARVAARLHASGIRTLVAYPKLGVAPRTLDGSPARAVELDARLGDMRSVRDTLRVIRRENVQVLYLTDRPVRAAAYALARLAGVRHIVVHDHTSGERSVPAGAWRAAKWVLGRAPWIGADTVVAVSEYVARRQVRTGLVPAGRVTRVWNGTPVPDGIDDARARWQLRDALGLPPDRPVVACACRAAPEKGVAVLLDAFDLLWQAWHGAGRPVLVYLGDGPDMPRLRERRERLAAKQDVLLAGYREDAPSLVAGADVCVMPSLWHDALPLAVMQPMALGRPVVASAVGGIPEMIADGESGVLVPPGDAPALAAALRRLLAEPALAARLGACARERVRHAFTPSAQIDALTAIVGTGFGLRDAASPVQLT